MDRPVCGPRTGAKRNAHGAQGDALFIYESRTTGWGVGKEEHSTL